MSKVSVAQFAREMKLRNFTPEIDLEEVHITKSDVNRPGLELTGYFEHFAKGRIQIIGKVESSYLEQLPADLREKRYVKLLDQDIPCMVMCRGFAPYGKAIAKARERGIPILGTRKSTSNFMAQAIRYLSGELAPSISIHGVLVDIYGEGVLLLGESGIGKSEAALELIRRGHRLVTDDVVEIRKMSDDTLVGQSPQITQYFIELRGIGIVDVKTLFGVEAVKERQTIDLVIRLEHWERAREYDRLGMDEEYTEILGTKVVCHTIPIRPGRNLAVICETAAVNHRQKKMGYNAAAELYRRVQENLEEGGRTDDARENTKKSQDKNEISRNKKGAL
ncbi:MAG: HPr(Ser) kinase/phosphatase [Clostridiales bacterium]|nr:HPr(Ser) kinase/phosphatase [Clostridiales bacterium]